MTLRLGDLASLTEGSALVTFEAQGSGCVLCVSDAAGADCRPGLDALVHPAGDVGVDGARQPEVCYEAAQSPV